MAERRKFRWLRRLKWPGIVVALLIGLVYGLLPLIVTPMIRSRLQKQLSTQLNAELQMGRVYYWFPYGVSVSDAVLVARDQQGEAIRLLKIDKLKLSLARLPFGEGPLIIRKLILQRPQIHLLVTDEGIVGRHSLVKDESPEPQATTTTSEPAPATVPSQQPQRRPKLSEMLELRQVRVEDAQIIYEDRKSPQSVPAAWRNINIDLATTPATNPLYAFDFTAANGTLAELRMSGTINVDELEVSLKQIAARVNLANQENESAVPAALQRMLLDNHVRGNFDMSGTALLPLRKMEEAQFDLRVKLADGSARIAKWHSEKDPDDTFDRINASFRWSSEPLTEEQAFMATAGQVRAANGAAASAPSGGKRKRIPAAYLLVEQAEILMADNRLDVKNAALAYDMRLREWEIKHVHGTLALGEQKEQLPKPLRAAIEKPQFFGVMDIALDAKGSMVKPEPGAARPYLLKIKATTPELILSPRRLVGTNVSCNMLITPGLVQFISPEDGKPAFTASFYGGTVAAFGAIRTGKPTHFDFAGNFTNIDLTAFAADWTQSQEKISKLNGRGFVSMQIGWSGAHGGKTTAQLLTSEGTFEILDGEFYELPVFSAIGAAMTLNKSAGTVGQAAARFKIANREVHFKPIAVSSPMMGLRGEGKLTFDGDLDFKAVAAPLADWKEQMQKSKIPLLDSVGAELVGGVQKILDSTTGKLLYQFTITGNRSKPIVTPQAAPILTEDGTKLLKEMIKGTGRLLDQI